MDISKLSPKIKIQIKSVRKRTSSINNSSYSGKQRYQNTWSTEDGREHNVFGFGYAMAISEISRKRREEDEKGEKKRDMRMRF